MTDVLEVIDRRLAETKDREIVSTLEVRDWLLDLRCLLMARETETLVMPGTMS